MNIKCMLNEYKDIDRLIREYTSELNQLNESMRTLNNCQATDNIRASIITDMPRGSGVGDPTSQAILVTIDRLEKRMTEISIEVDRLLTSKRAISEAIKGLNNKEKEIIELTYFEKLQPWQVRNKLNIPESSFWWTHDKALEKINKNIKQNKSA